MEGTLRFIKEISEGESILSSAATVSSEKLNSQLSVYRLKYSDRKHVYNWEELSRGGSLTFKIMHIQFA